EVVRAKYSGIIFDTSILVELFTRPALIDQLYERFSELKFYIPDTVYSELVALSNKDTTKGRIAKTILERIHHDKMFIRVKSVHSETDKDLIQLAKENKYLIATTDRNVRRIARKENIKVMFIKGSMLYLT
ncbi:MAG: PIN domain-containing protein, partial [Candidatus Geothermarchaeota archaeon]